MIQNPLYTVAQYGIGPIGAEIVKVILSKPWLKLVAAVDVDPAKVGRDVGEVLELGQTTGVMVTPDLRAKPDVVCHSTGSRLIEVDEQLRILLGRGCHVISTCEELAFPLDRDIRESLQTIARTSNVTLLGTGVNPGFVMDKLPLTLSSVCQEVRSIEIHRVVDAALRRQPLQKKVGAGMSRDDFDHAVAGGTIKHMGLRESLFMIANGLRVELEHVSGEVIRPMIAPERIVTDFVTVEAGEVAGVHQAISGSTHRGLELLLDIRMYVGAKDAADRIDIKGVPDVSMVIAGGIHGDRATAAMVVNAIPRVVAARPGVLSMDDIPTSYR